MAVVHKIRDISTTGFSLISYCIQLEDAELFVLNEQQLLKVLFICIDIISSCVLGRCELMNGLSSNLLSHA